MSTQFTPEEALAEIQDIMGRTVVQSPIKDSFLLGLKNADTLIRALNSAGWSWIRTDE